LGGILPDHEVRDYQYGHTPLAFPAATKSGNRISIEFNVQLLKGPNGETFGVAAFLRDVTARRQEDIALRRRLALLEARLQTTSSGETKMIK
jgi:hypothetical protein